MLRQTAPIHFECQQCGTCCRLEGQVRLVEEDIGRLAGFLGLSKNEFVESYTELAWSRRGLVLKDQPQGGCIFLEASGCHVNSAKPQQCSGFPEVWHNPGWERYCRGAARLRRQSPDGAG